MHAVEKMLARAAGCDSVTPGEILNCSVDFIELNDLYLQVVRSFYEMGGTKVWDPTKISFVFDHYSPAPTIRTAQIHKEMRDFARKQGLTHHFDINAGVCHQVMPEAGLIRPGMILVATDSHTTTHGAFGAFGTGIGATDAATVLISGELWFRVPEVIKIEIAGEPGTGIYAKDVILHIIGKLKADAAVYQAVEFCGEYVEGLGVSERMAICNMAVEMGAKTAWMKPNRAVLDYVEERFGTDYILDETDPGYFYAGEYLFDVSVLEPQLACPHSVDNVFPVSEVSPVKVDQAFIGSCTGGRLEDLEAAAIVLKGRKISPETRMVVIPASMEVYKKAMEKGYVQTLIEAGATFNAPGCGPCLGTHAGILAKGEVCVSSTNRNFPGRMGSPEAEIYLGSPALVAASALAGSLADPGKYLSTPEGASA
ncbi:3-isopropylmalate dehydratase large subunit [Marispirochaeta aestuarii]|uniref:3-isopropylmalate dehydratase large subunit n=1 Tax=Marispirochaeta aestuarii TaxID=1963862 RepID=UPI0029C95C28|nr:3-isopropylmalate dehydratase large subunit [Marispirochaeta aestuarii]